MIRVVRNVQKGNSLSATENDLPNGMYFLQSSNQEGFLILILMRKLTILGKMILVISITFVVVVFFYIYRNK